MPRVKMLTAAAAAAAAAGLLGPVAAGERRHGPQVLMTSVRTGDTEVFVVDLEFGDATNLSRAPASHDRYPMWSPGGDEVVFTSDRAGADTFNVYAMRADGSRVRALTSVKKGAVCYFPTWSGAQIVFGYDPGDGSPAAIARVRPDGTGFTVVGPGRDPAISPDGRTIAFTDRVDKGHVVFLMDADGRNRRQLTTHENEIGAVTPTWSPDGRRLIYSDQVGQALELFTVGADGSGVTQLTRLGQIAASASWSPDMRRILFRVTDEPYWRRPDAKAYAYSEKRPDKRPLWIMDADGGNARVVESLRYMGAIDGSRGAWRPR